MNYATVDYHGGRFAIQNTVDGTLLKSKESSSVISFSKKERADKVRDFFQHQYNLIAEAGKTWLLKVDGQMKKVYID
jgi:hypothetical protein